MSRKNRGHKQNRKSNPNKNTNQQNKSTEPIKVNEVPLKKELPIVEVAAAREEQPIDNLLRSRKNKDPKKDNNKISNKKKGGKGRKILKYILLFLLFLLIGGGGYVTYEYFNLQPANHFKQVPVAGANKGEQSNGSFNVLLLGSDARPSDGTVGRTDSMVVIHVDLQKHEYNMMSIPRDTRVYLDGYGYTKITSASYIRQSLGGTQAGINEAIKQVNKLTGLTINYYAETDYSGFQAMVDAIGGINMNIPFKVTLTHPWDQKNLNKVIQPGNQFFDGVMVSEITHERYSVPGTDYGRQQLQKEALVGIAKAMEKPANLTKLPDLMKSIPKFLIASNLSTEDMLSFAMSAKGFDQKQLQYFQVPGEGQTMYDDVLQANNSQIILNQQDLQKIVAEHFKN